MMTATESITLTMKMSSNPFRINGDTEGITYRFRDFDYTHQQTLMLKSNGQVPPDLADNPLFTLKGVASGTMCDCVFDLVQRRDQESRDGQRDRVKDVLGLRLSSVQPHTNGKSS